MNVGTVKEIWRFPVKSMQGARLDAARVSTQGIAGDRAWAMRDETRREVQWGKRFPLLMQCRASYRAEPDGATVPPVDITFPDGETIGSDDPAVHAKLSALFGIAARLWPLQPAANVAFYKRYKPDEAQFIQEIVAAFAREPGEPMPDLSQFPEVLMDHVAVPGTFFDNEELNLLTTASLAHLQRTEPAASWDVRRFRPNFLVETQHGITGLAEQDWLGRRLRLGEVEITIAAPTPRCGMTVQPQGELACDRLILRTIVRAAAQNLGVGAHCATPGTVRVGDPVELLD
ncbi:MAG: MOSC domain-containing protein [Gammaproteobacteria bacterium]|nr:MOSC domain-containing protein [Gammaproteobacteria bacterium]